MKWAFGGPAHFAGEEKSGSHCCRLSPHHRRQGNPNSNGDVTVTTPLQFTVGLLGVSLPLSPQGIVMML
ncbi:hypothetical protein Csa_008311 [Cucumis sativus]|uniref:Uncharacterized protein n=1 Tax=Cucumis sativus TaxID=3659 RepID=A0A0A0KQ38_CUCSA|nr:hypothetical protein Csa_008311 [Cucumis sativus]